MAPWNDKRSQNDLTQEFKAVTNEQSKPAATKEKAVNLSKETKTQRANGNFIYLRFIYFGAGAVV